MDEEAISNLLSKLSDPHGRLVNARPFTSYDEREFDTMVLNTKHFSEAAYFGEVPSCDNCQCLMAKFDLRYVCETCGCEEDILGDDTDAAAEYYARGGTNGNNTTGKSSAPLRINGPGAHMLQKKLIGSVSNYKVQQHKNTVEEMTSVVFQYEGAKIPKDVVLAAAELYYAVQQCEIRRGEVRKGTMAACLYRKCIENNITRKPKEIADIFDIPQTDLSFGEKILDRLISEGQLDATSTQMYFNAGQEVESFTDRYFEDLDISTANPDYKNFVTQLIKFTLDKHIADSSVPSSKCAGAIYILALKRDELNLKWNDIQSKCKISKSTFTRFAKAVLEATEATCGEPGNNTHLKTCNICRTRQQLRHIFKKNNIPL
jgi:transcription initiation factor TFIIIB Brf1 subunit/transcription initiation factor TFIIB